MRNSNQVRIPSLDGLRAISVLFVIISHSTHALRYYIDLGNLGVRMFFVISSYLITGILYRDVVKNRFDLRRFYFKRVMRTFPAFYFFLVVLFIFLWWKEMFDWSQFWRAPLYLENYHPRFEWNELQWFVGHSWSLAVEEQFYILIAILFYFFNVRLITKSNVIKSLFAVIIIIPFIRFLYMKADFIPFFLSGSKHRSFETVGDALAIGALGYLLKDKIILSVGRFYKWYWLLFAFLMIVFTAFLNSPLIRDLFGYSPRYIYNIFGIFFINALMLFIMFYGIYKPQATWFNKSLNTKPLVFIGTLSYSIYLWQQPWLYPWEIPFYLKLLGLLSFSLISYYLVEKPFLNLRDRMLLKIR